MGLDSSEARNFSRGTRIPRTCDCPLLPGHRTRTISVEPIEDARVLVKVGDSVTTDHISPAGAFPSSGPAGKYLMSKGVEPRDFNPWEPSRQS